MSLDKVEQSPDWMIEKYENLARERNSFERVWSEISDFVYPDSKGFFSKHSHRLRSVYDSTAVYALEKFASCMGSLLTPRGVTWHKLKVADKDLMKLDSVQIYLSKVRDMLFSTRYHPNSGFISAIHEAYKNLGAYGTQVVCTEESVGNGAGINYRSIPLSECYIETDFLGMVSGLFWKRWIPVKRLKEKLGGNLPGDLLRELKSYPDARCPILSYFSRNESGEECSKYPFIVHHINLNTGQIIFSGGYYEFPFHVSRFSASSRERYGYSPAMNSLAEIKMLNEMSKSILRAIEKLTDPPLAVAEEGTMMQPNLNPGAINPGAIDNSGKLLIQPIITQSDISPALNLMDQKRKSIEASFWVHLFDVFSNSRMTATEIMERVHEKSQLIGPVLARQENELFGDMILREIGILKRKGILPPKPEELEGERIEIEFTSPISKLNFMSEMQSLARSIQIAREVSTHSPEVMDNFDVDAIIREIARVNGVSTSYLRSKEEVDDKRRDV